MVQQVRILHCFCSSGESIPSPAEWGKDLVLPLMWHRLQLQPRNFHILRVWPKKEKKKDIEGLLQITHQVGPPGGADGETHKEGLSPFGLQVYFTS